MEDNSQIKNNYKKIYTNRNKECFIEREKYILNLNYVSKNEDKTFRCKFYNDSSIRCPGFVKINKNEEIVDYNTKHSCIYDEKAIKTLEIKNEVKNKMNIIGNIFNVKAKTIYDQSIKKITKRKSDNLPEEEEDNNAVQKNIVPSYNSIKPSIYRLINKNIPHDVENLSELPNDSPYYFTERGDKFMAYKTEKIVLLISKFQAQLIYSNNDHMFIDGTFYSSPKSAYQILSVRIHDIKTNNFYTVANAILVDKEMSTYIEVLMNLNEIIYNNRENKRIIEVFNPRTIHCDFELGIIGALKQVWPNSEIKLCLWNMFRNIELKRKKLFGDYSNHSIESYNIIKRIKTLVYIDPNYIKDVFNLISEDSENLGEKENNFVNNYFKKTYIEKFNIIEWNYYKVFDHRTNNACESYNHILNSKFNKKPSIWKLFAELINDENLLYIKIDNIKKNIGFDKQKKRGIKSFKDVAIPYYNKYDEEIKKISDSNAPNKREKIINVWYQACLEFPLYDEDL